MAFNATVRVEPDAQNRFREIFDANGREQAVEASPSPPFVDAYLHTQNSASGKAGLRARKTKRSSKNQKKRKTVATFSAQRHSNLNADFVLRAGNHVLKTTAGPTSDSDNVSEYSVAHTDMSMDSHSCDQVDEGVATNLALLDEHEALLRRERTVLEEKIKLANARTREAFEKQERELNSLRRHYENLRKAYEKALKKKTLLDGKNKDLKENLNSQKDLNDKMVTEIDGLAKQCEDYETAQKIFEDEIKSLRGIEKELARVSRDLEAMSEKNEDQATTIKDQSGIIGNLQGEKTGLTAQLDHLKQEVHKLESKLDEVHNAKVTEVLKLETQLALWLQTSAASTNKTEQLETDNKRLHVETVSQAEELRMLTAKYNAEHSHALAASDDNSQLRIQLECIGHEKTALLASSAEVEKRADKAEEKAEELRTKNTVLEKANEKLEQCLTTTKANAASLQKANDTYQITVANFGNDNARLTEQLSNTQEKLADLTMKHNALEDKRVDEKKKFKEVKEQKRVAEEHIRTQEKTLGMWKEAHADTQAELADLRKEATDLKERNAILGSRNTVLHDQNKTLITKITKKEAHERKLAADLERKVQENAELLDRLHILERRLQTTEGKYSSTKRELVKQHVKNKDYQRQTTLHPTALNANFEDRWAQEDRQEIERLSRMVIDLQGKAGSKGHLNVPMGNVNYSPSPIPLSSESTPVKELSPEMRSPLHRVFNAEELAQMH